MLQIELRNTAPIPEGTTIELPLSKSICNRYLILHFLLTDAEIQFPLSDSRDTQLLYKALKSHDAEVWFQDGATPYRFYLAYAAVKKHFVTLNGDTGLQQRSIKPLTDALETIGAQFNWINRVGFPPVQILNGILPNNEITIDRSMSSQYVSALMLIAPLLSDFYTIQLKGMSNSNSYIRLTAWCMAQYGVKSEILNDRIVIDSSGYKLPDALQVEPDWSSAAWFYMLCSASPVSSFLLKDLKTSSPQEDAVLAGLFQKLGVQSVQQPNGLFIYQQGDAESNCAFDLRDNIDLAPAVICTCAFHRLNAVFKGIENLKHKESNRIEALDANLQKLGVRLAEQNDTWTLEYQIEPEKGANISIQTFNDHRIAMAFSVFALRYNLEIDNAGCVEKSFPQYWQQLLKCNFEVNHVA